MQKNIHRNTSFLIILVIIISTIILIASPEINVEFKQTENDENAIVSQKKSTLNSLIPHINIDIVSDEDFVTLGFPGNGTESVPYRIENYDITTSNYIGIFITNTTKHFIIKDCFISALDFGIMIDEIASETATIENTTCMGHNLYGIYIIESNYVILKNNECYDNNQGIAVNTAHYLEITNNYCYDNGDGIRVLNSRYSTIQYNLLYNNFDGIGLYYLEKSKVEFNLLTDNIYLGIRIQYSKYSEIKDNYCTEGVFGIITEMSHNISIINNECQGNNQDGIYLRDVDDTIIEKNFSSKNNESGIRIAVCSNITIVDNTCTENKNAGVSTYFGSFTTLIPPKIEDNICRNNVIGMRIKETYHASISNNTCESNINGILLIDSKYTEIVSNVLLKNTRYGININTLLSTGNEIYSNYFLCNNLNGTEDGFSQAYDASFSDWYDEDTNAGNYYNDYSGEGEYMIDGSTERTDPYPMVYDYDCCSTEKTGYSYLVLLISSIFLTGIAVIGRKRLSLQLN